MERRAWLLLIALAAMWGASYLFIKVSLDDLSEGMIVFGRLALAALILVPFAAHKGVVGQLKRVKGPVVLVSLVQVAAPFLLITAGEQHVASSLTGILIASSPLFTALIAARFARDERSTGWRLVGVLIGIVGVGLLFGVDLSGDRDTAVGGVMILVASLGYAIGALLLKRTLSDVSPTAVVAGTMSTSALMTLPLALLTLPTAMPSGETIASMIALGIGGTGLAFVLFYGLIADVGVAKASVVAYIAPGFSVLYGATLLDEPLTLGTIGGLAFILAGSYLAAGGALPRPETTPAPAPAKP